MNKQDQQTHAAHMRDTIDTWDVFVTQVANAAVNKYTVEHNKWALYIPSLISELTHDVGVRIDQMLDDSDDQNTFMKQLMDEPAASADELPQEPQIDARLNQLTGRKPPQSLDPFRELTIEANPKDMLSEDDPDLIM